jgi:hypothetical protein
MHGFLSSWLKLLVDRFDLHSRGYDLVEVAGDNT